MSVSDQDLELLENFLDGDLPEDQESAMLTRLASEPSLRATADSLRAERALRSRVWQSMEGTDAEVAHVMEFVEKGVDQHTRWSYRLSTVKKISALAACILVGFVVGRGTLSPSSNSTVPAGPAVAQGPVTPGNPNLHQVNLSITNDRGELLGVQGFKSREEAARFIDDLNQWQRRQEQLKTSPNMNYTSEKF